MSKGLSDVNHEHAKTLVDFLSAHVMRTASGSFGERAEAWVYVQHLASQLCEHAKRSSAIDALTGER